MVDFCYVLLWLPYAVNYSYFCSNIYIGGLELRV